MMEVGSFPSLKKLDMNFSLANSAKSNDEKFTVDEKPTAPVDHSPVSVDGLENHLSIKKPSALIINEEFEASEKKINVNVSPTTKFIQDNNVRSNSPTDRNRSGRSPNVILKKRYLNHFNEESGKSTPPYSNT